VHRTKVYAPECVEGVFSEVAASAQLCYLVCKRSVGERRERREMHARMSIFEGRPDKIDEALRQAREVVLPQAKEMDPGFKGIIALTDRQSGKMVGITFWESEEAMRATEEGANRLREESAEAGEGTVAGVERYEVGLFEVPSPGPVSGVTDTVRGATDRLLGGGEEKQR
jgi:heme-degrading monooxygenase HmoA